MSEPTLQQTTVESKSDAASSAAAAAVAVAAADAQAAVPATAGTEEPAKVADAAEDTNDAQAEEPNTSVLVSGGATVRVGDHVILYANPEAVVSVVCRAARGVMF